MLRLILFLCLVIITCLEMAHLASFLPDRSKRPIEPNIGHGHMDYMPVATSQDPIQKTTATTGATTALPPATKTTTAAQFEVPVTTTGFVTTISTSNPPKGSTTQDPNADADDPVQQSPSPQGPLATTQSPEGGPNPDLPDTSQSPPNRSQPQGPQNTEPPNDGSGSTGQASARQPVSLELSILFYSIFIVYVSFVKLIYHNVPILKYYLTEPGILMIFGIFWELVTRQITSNYDAFPRFNSRIFFYLFLPSTVLESASLLSNKWLFTNLLPILIHAIIGTLCFASSLGFTIYSLTRYDILNLNPDGQQLVAPASTQQPQPSAPLFGLITTGPLTNATAGDTWTPELGFAISGQEVAAQQAGDNSQSGGTLDLASLTLADCLMLGTILSSVDSGTMLGVFRLLHVNDKLYYLVLGETLMNNAVVLVVFNLLLDFFNATRLTVSRVYFAVMHFYVTLFGSVFIGLLFAAIALVAVRLAKRLHVPSALSSYQNQCQAMVETLLILKLAYLTYTVAPLARTSRILSLATFGILQDQYIKHNLNLRSQLTFKQVILATRTMGFSLVYPLLGMLLVDVANTNQFYHNWQLSHRYESQQLQQQSLVAELPVGSMLSLAAASQANTNLQQPAIAKQPGGGSQASGSSHLYWNFKFLSLIIVFTLTFRFAVVLIMSLISNLFSSSQLKIKFREQILLAYGGLKGPIAFALVHRLIEHEQYRDRTLRNKHLFMYTILSVTFVSAILKGCFIWPLVSKMQHKLSSGLSSPLNGVQLVKQVNSSIVFDEINSRLTEHISHGLNSILGRTKSPYDRFVDFNELQIKPWLAGGSSNTNWLSVFYDNLILDETLNANCFYRSTELAPAAIIRQQYHDEQMTQSHRSVALSEELVDREPEAARPSDGPRDNPLPVRRSLAAGQSKRSSNIPAPTGRDQESAVLKELVMFNLKLEESRRRKRDASLASQVKPARVWPSEHQATSSFEALGDDYSEELGSGNGARMLSSTSSNQGIKTSSSIELTAGQQHPVGRSNINRQLAPWAEQDKNQLQGRSNIRGMDLAKRPSQVHPSSQQQQPAVDPTKEISRSKFVPKSRNIDPARGIRGNKAARVRAANNRKQLRQKP